MSDEKKAQEKGPNETSKYIVVKKGCLGYKVGEPIDLTDRRARSLVGKVRPIGEHEKEIEANAAVGSMREDLDKANLRIKELGKELTRQAKDLQNALKAKK